MIIRWRERRCGRVRALLLRYLAVIEDVIRVFGRETTVRNFSVELGVSEATSSPQIGVSFSSSGKGFSLAEFTFSQICIIQKL